MQHPTAAHRPSRHLRSEEGFTLVEIMVVVLIIGMLAGIVGPAILARQGEAQIDTAKAQIVGINDAAEMYMLRNPGIPTLEDLCTPDEKGESYLKLKFDGDLPTDPWGNEYVIEELGGRNFDVRSFGPDGEDGTEDDISIKGDQDR